MDTKNHLYYHQSRSVDEQCLKLVFNQDFKENFNNYLKIPKYELKSTFII